MRSSRFGRVDARRPAARRQPQPAMVPRARIAERLRRLRGRRRRHAVDAAVPAPGRRRAARGARVRRRRRLDAARCGWTAACAARSSCCCTRAEFANGAAARWHAVAARHRRTTTCAAPADYDRVVRLLTGPGGRPRALGRRRARLRAPRRRARAARARRADRPRRRHQHGRHPRRGRRLGLGRRGARPALQALLRRHQSALGLHAAARVARLRPQGRHAAAPRARRHRHRGPAAAVLLRVVEPHDRPHRRAPAGPAVAVAARLGRDSRACCRRSSRAARSSSTAAR